MKCWNCETENREDTIYCQQCGKVLTQKVNEFEDMSTKEYICKFKLDWGVMAYASLIFMFFASLVYKKWEYEIWIPTLLSGAYIGSEFRNKPHFFINFIITLLISLMLSMPIFLLLGFCK